MINYDSLFDELEKIALGESGADVFKKQVARARLRTERVDKLESAGRTVDPRFKKGTIKKVPFMEGLKRNVVATGRRLKNPKQLASRLKWSVTNPAAPKWMRGAAAAGIGLTALDTLRKTRPGEKSRLRRALSGAGGLIGGSAGRGLSGGLVAGTVGSQVGDLAGAAIDRIRGYKPPSE